MKGLALCSVLFCGLALVLVYAASSGMGARTPSFSSDNYIQAPKAQSFMQPVVEIETVPSQTPQPELAVTSAPEVNVTRNERRRKTAKKKPEQSATAEKPEADPAPHSKEAAKPQTENESPKPVAAAVEEPKPAPEPLKEELPAHKRDVTDAGPMAQVEADREWRRQTLARWQKEAEASRDGAKLSTVIRIRVGQEAELKGTPVEGLFPADRLKEGQDKKKKKPSRSFSIKW
jgi:outer membrane biosynthesis protein TonB